MMYHVRVIGPIVKRIIQHHDMDDRGNVGRRDGSMDVLKVNSERPDLDEWAVRRYQLERGDLETAPWARWRTSANSDTSICDAGRAKNQSVPKTERLYVKAVNLEKSRVLYAEETIRSLSRPGISKANNFKVFAQAGEFFAKRKSNGADASGG